MRFFLIIFLSLWRLHAEPLALFSAFEGNSSGWVEDCVDVITGCYREQVTDYIVDGPDSLSIDRRYTNRDYKTGREEGGWLFCPHCTLVVGNDSEEKKGYTADTRGGFLPLFIKDGVQIGGILSKDVKGITNCSGSISGQTHPKNIFLKARENGYEILTGNGTKRVYIKQKVFATEYGNFFGGRFYQACASTLQNPTFYVLTEERLPSGNRQVPFSGNHSL